MPVVSLKEIVDPALEQRYGVPAINILNDLTLEGVLLAAVQERSPLIVQTSVKTVRSIGGNRSDRGKSPPPRRVVPPMPRRRNCT